MHYNWPKQIPTVIWYRLSWGKEKSPRHLLIKAMFFKQSWYLLFLKNNFIIIYHLSQTARLWGKQVLTSSVQFSRSVVSDSLRPHESQHARLPCPSPTSGVHPNGWSSMEFTSIELVMPSSHLILCRPLFLLPPTPPSIRVFSNELTLCMRWPKYWSFSFSIIPSKEHPGLISFRMD